MKNERKTYATDRTLSATIDEKRDIIVILPYCE